MTWICLGASAAPSAVLILLQSVRALPALNKVALFDLLKSNKVWWEGGSTDLNWVRFLELKKAGHVKSIAVQFCVLPLPHLKHFYQAHLLVLFLFLPPTTTSAGAVALGGLPSLEI